MYSWKIETSLDAILSDDWDALFGDTPEGYGFYKTLEASRLQEFVFLYLLIYQGHELQLIAPLFIADFPLDIAVEGPAKKILQWLRRIFPRFFILKTLFCGSPCAENGMLGIRKDSPDRTGLVQELAAALTAVSREKKTSLILFKDFLSEDLSLLQPLRQQGFFLANSFPSTVADLSFQSLNEYLQSLSLGIRKDLRRKMKKNAALWETIQVRVVPDVESCIDDVYRLYLNTYSAGQTKFEKLTREFFLNIAKYMPSQTRFFLCYQNSRLIAYNLCFLQHDLLIDKFIGFDYTWARQYQMYFFTWLSNITWCLKNGVRHYQVGQTDYQLKIKLGGRLIPLYALIRHNNPLVNLLLKQAAKILQPENFDQSLT